VQLIDSLEALFDSQLELLQSRPIEKQAYAEWEFLKSWDGLELKAKHKKYDKFCSHELNLFLYYKDKVYFQEFVRPFIANKLEKSFVDRFLLDQKQ